MFKRRFTEEQTLFRASTPMPGSTRIHAGASKIMKHITSPDLLDRDHIPFNERDLTIG